jgi:large-conductance mechanosensitive channel
MARNILSTIMNLPLVALILFATVACAPQISAERAAERAAEDRANHQAYLQEQYDDEKFCETFGC